MNNRSVKRQEFLGCSFSDKASDSPASFSDGK